MNNCYPNNIKIVKGDYGFDLQFTLEKHDGTALDLTDNTSIKFNIQLQNSETVVSNTAQVVDATTGVIKYTVGENDFPLIGNYNVEIVVNYAGIVISFNNLIIKVLQDLPDFGD